MKRAIAIAVVAAGIGGVLAHSFDAYLVATVLGSEDHSIYRNVEQTNALIDSLESHRPIARNAQGIELDVVKVSGGRVADAVGW